LVDAGEWLDCPRQAEDGVQLVDVAVGLDARVVLLDPAATKQPSVPGVAGLCINLHRLESTEL